MDIPIEVSARHIHVSQTDLEILFGIEARLHVYRYLSQPDQYAAEETVILKTSDGEISHVRIVGPTREHTQVELSRSDARILHINPPLAISGNLRKASEITVIGSRGVVTSKCAIVPQRHIHAHPNEAKKIGLKHGDEVSVSVSGDRALIFHHVFVRTDKRYHFHLHLDTDEGNACGPPGDLMRHFRGTIIPTDKKS